MRREAPPGRWFLTLPGLTLPPGLPPRLTPRKRGGLFLQVSVIESSQRWVREPNAPPHFRALANLQDSPRNPQLQSVSWREIVKAERGDENGERLRDARRPLLHARSLRRGRGHRRPVVDRDPPAIDPALLGAHEEAVRGAGRRSRKTDRGRAHEVPVATGVRIRDQSAAPGRPGCQRPAREAGRVRADRDGAARSGPSCRVPFGPGRGPRLRRQGESPRDDGRHRTLPRRTHRGPLPGGNGTRDRRQGRGADRRSEDGPAPPARRARDHAGDFRTRQAQAGDLPLRAERDPHGPGSCRDRDLVDCDRDQGRAFRLRDP